MIRSVLRVVPAVALLATSGCFTDTQSESTGEASASSTGSMDGTSSGTGSEESTSTSTTDDGSTSIVASSSGLGSTSNLDSTGQTTGTACGPDVCATGRCDERGRCERLIFVTQATYPSDFAGVLTADQICAVEASDAGLEGEFAALLSTDETAQELFDRLAITPERDDVFLLPGEDDTAIGDAMALRVDLDPEAELAHPIDRDASGSEPPYEGDPATTCGGEQLRSVWTGISGASNGFGAGNSCDAWTGGGIEHTSGSTGRNNNTASGWLRVASCNCTMAAGREPALARLYCVEVG